MRAGTAVACLVVLAGCTTVSSPVREGGPPAADPCAARLHTLSGALLLYHSGHGRLPDSLEALAELDDSPPAVCPASGERYVYRPEGIALPGGAGRVVLFDATPCHSGGGWGVVVTNESPLTMRVIWFDEAMMRSFEAAGA
jgi:hypothetical protein